MEQTTEIASLYDILPGHTTASDHVADRGLYNMIEPNTVYDMGCLRTSEAVTIINDGTEHSGWYGMSA